MGVWLGKVERSVMLDIDITRYIIQGDCELGRDADKRGKQKVWSGLSDEGVVTL